MLHMMSAVNLFMIITDSNKKTKYMPKYYSCAKIQHASPSLTGGSQNLWWLLIPFIQAPGQFVANGFVKVFLPDAYQVK